MLKILAAVGSCLAPVASLPLRMTLTNTTHHLHTFTIPVLGTKGATWTSYG